MSDNRSAIERWENEGGSSQMIMNAKIQRLAGSWFLPLTIFLLSPVIVGTLWAKWRKR
jgi:hypothetical protein